MLSIWESFKADQENFQRQENAIFFSDRTSNMEVQCKQGPMMS